MNKKACTLHDIHEVITDDGVGSGWAYHVKRDCRRSTCAHNGAETATPKVVTAKPDDPKLGARIAHREHRMDAAIPQGNGISEALMDAAPSFVGARIARAGIPVAALELA